MRICYFTSAYPRATDTFIQREVVNLNSAGLSVLTAALRQPAESNNVSGLILEQRKKTTYLLPAQLFNLFALNICYLLKQPKKYLSTLRLAYQTRRPGIKGFFYQLFYFQEAILLASHLIKHNVNHLHNHFGDSSGTVALLAAKLSGVSLSITFHGPHIFFEPTLFALKEKIKQATFIVCISHFCKSQLMLFSEPADWHKLHIVHCGVEVNAYSESSYRKKLNVNNPTKLLYVGRLAAEKGVVVLLQSLIMLKQQGYSFYLTLLGDGPERQALETEVIKHQLQDMVYFAGFAGQDLVRKTLQESDVFVLPSFAEGVPVSLMEAMASRVPVIATNVGGVTELIEHGVSGLVVPPSDAVSLKDAIASYIDHPELRESVSKFGRSVIEQNFNINTEVTKLHQLFLKHHG